MSSTTDFGTDLNFDITTMDIPNNFNTTSGRDNLIKACIRRITTPRGRLIYDPNYGIYIQDYLNDDIDIRTVAQIGGLIDNELLKDERIIKSSTEANYFRGILTTVTTLVDGNGPFKLVLAISAVTVNVLQVG